MSAMMSEEQASEILQNGRKEAELLLKDDRKTEESLLQVEKKIKNGSLSEETQEIVSTMISLIRSYKNHTYTQIDTGIILYIMSGLLYLLYPIDFVPDVLPEVGYQDDEVVISVLYSWVKEDLEIYRNENLK